MTEMEAAFYNLIAACGETIELTEADMEDITEEQAMQVLAESDPFQNTVGCAWVGP